MEPKHPAVVFEAKLLPSPGSPRESLDSEGQAGNSNKAILLPISPKLLKPDRALEDGPDCAEELFLIRWLPPEGTPLAPQLILEWPSHGDRCCLGRVLGVGQLDLEGETA